MKLAFIILAHESPEQLRPLITCLLETGSYVYIHHDLSSSHNLQKEINTWELNRSEKNIYFAERIKVGWGEWSIVQATLNCLHLARKHECDADYYILLSGSCMPNRPFFELADFLTKNPNIDYIETVDVTKTRWVKGGIQQKRWEKYHFFNWREQKTLFELSLWIQNKLRIKRSLPNNHIPHMGSQWWSLTRATIERLLNILDKNPSIIKFYRSTCIPDELFFQTLTANLNDKKNISPNILTKYKFNSWGIPRVYYNDDYSELLVESSFFSRKISHSASPLKHKLAKMFVIKPDEQITIMKDPENPDAKHLIQKEYQKNSENLIKWFNISTDHKNPRVLVESIPSRFVVIYGGSPRLRKKTLETLKEHKNTIILGELSNYKTETSDKLLDKLIQKKDIHTSFHFILRDIARLFTTETICFSLAEDAIMSIGNFKDIDNLILIDIDLANKEINKNLISYSHKSLDQYHLLKTKALEEYHLLKAKNILDATLEKYNQKTLTST